LSEERLANTKVLLRTNTYCINILKTFDSLFHEFIVFGWKAIEGEEK
jgi:hypothetical protein